MTGAFQGRIAFCTLEIDAGAGTATIVQQSGDFDEAPVVPIYTAAGNYRLTLKAGLGIEATEAVYNVGVGQGCNVAGTAFVVAAADQAIRINYFRMAGGLINPSSAVGRLHLVVVCKPQN